MGSQLSSPVTPDVDPPATVTEVVTEARRHCLHAIKRLRAILDNKGGRGAGSINVAARTILETARVNGAEAEALEKMPLAEAVQRLRLVDSDKAVELLRQRRLAEHGGSK